MKIDIQPYNPNWKSQFDVESNILCNLLAIYHPIIEHIGSTSIPNCYAKPIIDIMIGINSVDDFDSIISILIQQNYIYYKLYDKLIPERRFFAKYDKEQRLNTISKNDELIALQNEKKICHIHLTVLNNEFWNRHIAFRDYLMNDENEIVNYNELKLELSKKNWKDGNGYNNAKNDFIKSIEKKALNWYSSKEIV